VDKAETLQEMVDQRRENQRLRKKLKKKRRWKKLNRAVSASMLVSTAIFLTLVTPIHLGMLQNGSNYEVVISENQLQTFDQYYTTEVENGFCLYGDIEDKQVVIDDVVYVDDPWKQTRTSMKFSCIPETLERLPQLLKQGDFGFLGIVHTHPSGSASLSDSDAAMLGATWYFTKISGVYNGEQVEFYSFEDPRFSMPLQIN
jgi:proteasome lid subunit RPN8/RPN11